MPNKNTSNTLDLDAYFAEQDAPDANKPDAVQPSAAQPLANEWTQPGKININMPTVKQNVSGLTPDQIAMMEGQQRESDDAALRERVGKLVKQSEASRFIGEARMQSPNMQRQAELEYNKSLVKKKLNNDFNDRVKQIQSTNPKLDPVSVYDQAVREQSQQDVDIDQNIKRIGNNTFDNAIGLKSIVKSLPQESDFDKDYFNSDKYKRDIYIASGGNPRLFKQMGEEIAERRSLEYKNAPTRIAQMQQALLDHTHNPGDPVTRALYYGLVAGVSGVQSLAKLGAAGAATINAATGVNSLTDSENKQSFLSRFSKLNQKNRDIIKKYSPEAKSEGESGSVDETMASAARMIGELGAAGYAKLPLLGSLGKSELFTNNLITQAIGKMPVNKVAQFMDNYTGMAKSIGPIIYGDYYEQMKAKGYGDEEAAQKALTRTGVNLAAFSAISPFQGAARNNKVLSSLVPERYASKMTKYIDNVKNIAKDAGKVTIEGIGAVTADAYQDFNDAKEKGFIGKNEVFQPGEAIKQGIMAAPVNITAILGNRLIGGHGKLPERTQAESLSQAITDRSSFESELRDNIRKGNMTEQEAARAIGLIDAVAPYYEEGLGFTTPDGQPYTPAMAAQHGVERARFQEAFDKLTDVQDRLKDVQIADIDGQPVPMANENGTYSAEAYTRLKNQEIKYKEQAEKSGRAIQQLSNGDYTKGQLLSSEEILGRTPVDEVRSIAIEDNGPYESETVRVEDVANDPSVQQRISELESNPEAQLNPSEPIVTDVNGSVLSGHDAIAEAVLNGDVTLDAFRPTSKEKMDSIVAEDVIGESVNKEGLDRDQSRILDEIKSVFDKAKETVGEGGAFSAAAADIAERGYTKPEAIDQLLRVVNGEVSRPVAEFYYNEALRQQAAKEKVPRENMDQPIESQLTIEENPQQNGLSDITADRNVPLPTEIVQEPATGQETIIENETTSIEPDQQVLYNRLNNRITEINNEFREGLRQGKKDQKTLQAEYGKRITDFIRDANLKGDISRVQAKSLIKRAANVGTSEYRLNKFLEYAQKVIQDANYAQNVDNATTLQQRIRKVAKSSSTFADHLPVLDALKRIPIDNLSTQSLDKFIDAAEKYNKSRLPVTSENYAPFDVENARNILADIQSELDTQTIRQAEDISGLTGLSKEDADMIIEAMDADEPNIYIDNLNESKRKQLTDALRKQASYSQIGAKDVLSDPLFTENIPSKGVQMLREIADADLSSIDAKALVPLIKTLDNSIVNGSIANVGKVYQAVKSVNDAKVLKGLNTSGKLFQLNKIQEAAESLPVILKSIYGQSKLAANFRRLTGFDDVFNGGSKTDLNLTRTHKEWEKYKKENKISNNAEDRFKRGMYAVLIQNEGGSKAQINEQFLINKGKIEQSIEALKQRISTQKEAETLEKIYNSDFAPYDNVEQLQSDFASKYPAQVKAVRFFQKQFGNIKDDLKFITEAYQNEKFDEVNNYTPLSYRFIDNAMLETPESGMYFVDRYAGRPRQTPTTISRSGSNNVPVGGAIDFDFDYNMFNKLKKANYDINTISGRSKFSEISKLKDFTESVGGGDNKERLIRQYNQAERTQAGDKSENDVAGQLLQYTLSPLRKAAGAFALGGFTQLPKQYISVGVKTLFTLGKDAPILLDVMKNASNRKVPLLELASISNRGSRQGGLNIGDNLPLENRAAQGLRKVMDKYGVIVDKNLDRVLKPLEFGDSSIARQSWLAYYMQFMKSKGMPIEAKDLSTEHERIDPVREEAMAYANQMVDETQVVSNAALQADLSRNKGNAWKDVLRNIYTPFNTFAANHRARMVEDWKFITRGSSEQRSEAIRDIIGNTAEIAAFNSLKAFALSYLLYEPGKDFLNWLFDLNIENEDEQKAFLSNVKKMKTDMVKDLTVSGIGSMGENGMIEGVNAVDYWINKMTNPSFNKTYRDFIKTESPLYPPNENSTTPLLDHMGSYGILPKELIQDYRDVEGLISGSLIDEYVSKGKTEKKNKETERTIRQKTDKELTANQRKYMVLVAAADLLGVLGLRDADVMRTLQNTKRSMIKQKK